MDLEYKRGIFFVRLKGKLARKSCNKINNYVIPVLKKHKIKNCIVNLKGIQNIEESGINSLRHMKCTIKQNKGHIYLCLNNREIKMQLKNLRIKSFSSERTALKMIEV